MTAAAREVSRSRAALEERAYRSLVAQDFHAGLAPLCRLLLALDPCDPERTVVLACLAVVYARIGRPADAERTLRQAETAARGARAFGAARLARAEVRGRGGATG